MNIKHLRPSKRSRYEQGYINPRACKKLFEKLKSQPVIFRSSYEKKFVLWLESSPSIKAWGSECFGIPYYSTLDKKTHTYYPDYFLVMADGSKIVVEVKPHNQTVAPANANAWGAREYVRNMCKWKAAEDYCKSRGFTFKIVTERTIERL